MYIIFLSLASILLCYKFGDWKNWRSYYPTILFFILSNVVCILLTYKHPLWLYSPTIINRTFTDLTIAITVYPSTMLIFLPNFPKAPVKILTHMSYYVAVYSLAEVIGFYTGYFSYYNGWNIWYSVIFNYIMFSILILHYKRPIIAWIVVLLSPHVLFFLFKVPYSVIR